MKRKKKPIQHHSRQKMVLGLTATVITLGALTYWANRSDHATKPSPSGTPIESSSTRPTAQKIPPFHMSVAAAEPLPQTLPPGWFSNPLVARAYRIAGQIPEVLAQQPCYCWCDRFGHGSLVDCYASDHGAG